MENEMIAMAWRHVVKGRRIVEQQRQRMQKISVLAPHGRSTENAEYTLQLFESTLAIFEQHLRDLTKRQDALPS